MKIVALFQIGFSHNRDTLDVRDNSNIRINSLIYSDQLIQKELSKGRNKTMNWKTLSLIAGLILTTSLTACSSSPASKNQIAPEASPAMSKDKAGDAMGKDAMGKDAMGKDAMGKDAMGKDAMGKDKAGDAMKQSPASTKP